MLKLILSTILGITIGFFTSKYIQINIPKDFLDVRLFEIIKLVATLCLGSFIAYHFSRRLNSIGKKRELLCTTIDCIEKDYRLLFANLVTFMSNPAAIKTTEITLSFKSLSSKIAILEQRYEKIGLKKDKLANLRNAHEILNNLITGETWGLDPKQIKYDENERQKSEKEFKNIEIYLEELKYSIFD